MRFTWTGLILAPLLVPALFSAAFASLSGGAWPALTFLIMMVPGCIVSYGTTIVLFLPCLFLLSLLRPMTGFSVCVVGLMLGAAMFVPLTLLEWQSSGTDSGPPEESFETFLVHSVADPFAMLFPLAGLITAGLYWWLGTRQRGRPIPA